MKLGYKLTHSYYNHELTVTEYRHLPLPNSSLLLEYYWKELWTVCTHTQLSYSYKFVAMSIIYVIAIQMYKEA